MSIAEDQYRRLTSYLDNRMSPQEEEAFMKELNEHADLQQEYDFELILRESLQHEAGTEESTVQPEFEEASVHLGKVEMLLRPPDRDKADPMPVGKVVYWSPGRIITVAAACLAVVLGILFYTQNRRDSILSDVKPRNNTLPVKRDSIPGSPVPPDTPANRPLLADNLSGSQAYRKYYSRYQGSDDDPVQASRYFNAYYYDKNYEEVLQASEAELQTKGADDRSAALYLRFYKALSYLETRQNARSIRQLTALLPQATPGSGLYHSVQWYLAMAYLKSDNVPEARKVLQLISTGKKTSPYKTRAVQLLKALG